MGKVRHVLGISGGKDSAALAIYLKNKHPELDIEYYTCDTGKELDETYELVEKLEKYLGKKIVLLQAKKDSLHSPFDYLLKIKGNYLPSHFSRWCTRELKLKPFEDWIKDDPVISYVGIRGDENREGYISKKTNIQSIFPFRRNIWSEDVISKVLNNSNIAQMVRLYEENSNEEDFNALRPYLEQPLSFEFPQKQKLESLLDAGTATFNKVVFQFLKNTKYPLAKEKGFSLLENEDNLVREDIFQILENSGIGVPEYYKKVAYQVDGKEGYYARSRSGCYFCFFQQKIEWVWLHEQHPHLYQLAMDYEKDGYTWIQDESLAELILPERIQQIKEDNIKRVEHAAANSRSDLLLDILGEAEEEGCAACFI